MIELSERTSKALRYLWKVKDKKCKKCPSEKMEKCKNRGNGLIVDGVTLSFNCLNKREIKKVYRILGIKYEKSKK